MGSLSLAVDPCEVVIRPEQQTVQLIRSLHRESRGVIQFLRLRPGGGVAPGWPKRVPASHLDTPGFASDLLEEPDTYMTINGLREGASRARVDNVQFLNALWVDCDCHDLSRDEQQAQLKALEASGLLPPPNLVAWSGRGFWLLWKLTDGRETTPPTVDEGRAALHREIASEIVQAIERDFPELRPDKASVNVNRLIRVPGSINSKSRTAVRWEVQDPGKDYRLEEWPRKGVAPRCPATTRRSSFPQLPIPSQSTNAAASKPEPWDGFIPIARNAEGSLMRWSREIGDFHRLRELRGGFQEGTRNSAAWLYAYLLRQRWTEEEEISQRVEQLAAECRPPLSDDEWRAAVRSSRSVWRPLTRLEIVTKLGVTPDESRHLDRWHDPEAQQRIKEERKSRKRQKRYTPKERQASMTNVVKRLAGEIPSIRTMHQLLMADGVRVSRNTCAKDYRSLGFS